MDKVITSHKQKLGNEGEVSATLGIKGQNIRIEAAVAYEKPVADVVDPVLKKVDELVDWVEKKIPGDQMAEANRLKEEIRKTLVGSLIGAIPDQAQALDAPQAEPQDAAPKA